MNVVLSYYNMLDDWNDDKNLLALGEAQVFLKKNAKRLRLPTQDSVR